MHPEHADRFPSSVPAGGDASMGRGAPGGSSHRRGLLFLSREENQREVGALGHVDFMHGLSRGEDTGRHDDLDPGHAEGSDLLRVPREIRGTAPARARRESAMCGLSRCPQQRPTHVAASGGRTSAVCAQGKIGRPFAFLNFFNPGMSYAEDFGWHVSSGNLSA